MRCEVVAIGTELLLGQIVDTNSSWIGEQLALVGIDSLYQVKVGDNAKRMEDTIRAALARSDAVICCGGLGPTQDDITREVIAKIMGVRMHRDENIAGKIMLDSLNNSLFQVVMCLWRTLLFYAGAVFICGNFGIVRDWKELFVIFKGEQNVFNSTIVSQQYNTKVRLHISL